jgi:hypothetical protein
LFRIPGRDSSAARVLALLSPSAFTISLSSTVLLLILAIPQAVQAKYNDDPYLQYQLHLAADDQNPAHQIVVTELAPEAIMRNDLDLLRRLLDRFQDSRVEGWNEGGKVGYLSLLLSVSEF